MKKLLRYLRAVVLALRDLAAAALTAPENLDNPPIIFLSHMTGTVEVIDTAQQQ